MLVVVCYDIAEDRRRLKVMKTLKGYGNHVQESVFECDLEPRQLQRLQRRLERLIRPEADLVRYYHLCEACVRRIEVIGPGPSAGLRTGVVERTPSYYVA